MTSNTRSAGRAAMGKRRLHLSLDRDGFAKDQPILLTRALDRLDFELESRAPHKHEATLVIEGLTEGVCLLASGTMNRPFRAEAGRLPAISLPMPGGQNVHVRLEPATS